MCRCVAGLPMCLHLMGPFVPAHHCLASAIQLGKSQLLEEWIQEYALILQHLSLLCALPHRCCHSANQHLTMPCDNSEEGVCEAAQKLHSTSYAWIETRPAQQCRWTSCKNPAGSRLGGALTHKHGSSVDMMMGHHTGSSQGTAEWRGVHSPACPAVPHEHMT